MERLRLVKLMLLTFQTMSLHEILRDYILFGYYTITKKTRITNGQICR